MKIAENGRKRARQREKRRRGRARKRTAAEVSDTQQREHHESDNSGPDLAGRGQVPNEPGLGKVSSAFKLGGHF